MIRSKLVTIVEFIEILKKSPPNYQVRVYTENEGGQKVVSKPRTRLTLSVLVDKIDHLGNDLNDLRNEMDAGFKKVNTRIDRIDTRLDYIVEANNLKDNK